MIHQFEKHPDEQFFIGASILRVQQDGESVVLANSSIVVTDPDDTDVTSTILDVSYNRVMTDPDSTTETNNALVCLVRAGDADVEYYRIKFTVVTDSNHKWVVVVYMKPVVPE